MVAPMRALVVALLVAAPLSARADNIVELAGGFMTPISDDQWSDYSESGPKLAARAGVVGPKVGGLLSLDWSPINTDETGFGNVDVSAHRFRIQAMGVFHHNAGKLIASFRGGLGIDIASVSVNGDFFGIQIDESDTDVGLALEVAGGIWFPVGSVEVGGELALPMSFHSERTQQEDGIAIAEYTSVDLDLLFAVRFRSH
jgi:hypothetical protein